MSTETVSDSTPNWDVVNEHRAAGRLEEAVAAMLAIVAARPTPATYWRIERELARLDLGALARPPAARVKLALLGSSTLDLLRARLRVGCLQAGLVPEMYQGDYGQPRQAILDAQSPLYAFTPDLVFLSMRLVDFVPELRETALDLPPDLVTRVVKEVTHLAEQFTTRARGLLIVQNFLVPATSPRGLLENKLSGGLRRTIAELNHALDDAFRDSQQVFVLDYEHVAGVFGKAHACDPRRLYMADMEWSDDFVGALADVCLPYIKAARGILRKCIVLDLDQTLWGGIVGENGLDGIALDVQHPGNQFHDFQRAILELHRRGIILAVNSKNNFSDAIEVIRRHPYMVLREQHFASLKINWNDKVANMREIARELSIGLDSMVFIDDNPVERLRMRQALPEVLTVELPSDPSLYRKTLESMTDFDVLSLTEEDRRRGELYAAEFARTELRKASGSMDDFLASLGMTLVVRAADAFSIPRVAQLTQRTNQFTLTTRRYTEAQIGALAGSRDHLVVTARVTDVFGDNGLVGVAIVQTAPGHVWNLDTFLLSCRVLGRGVETSLLYVLLRRAQRQGVRAVTGEFIKTAKNEVAAEFLSRHGFARVEDHGEVQRWARDLAQGFDLPPWIVVDEDEEA